MLIFFFLIDHLYIEGRLYQPTLKKGDSCGSSVILAFIYKTVFFFPFFFKVNFTGSCKEINLGIGAVTA